MRALVCGAGGFISGWLVRRLLDEGHEVVAADIKPLAYWWQVHEDAANWDRVDLREFSQCRMVCRDSGTAHIYQLACDMGGIGHIETHRADCMVSVLINTNMLRAAREAEVKRYFYSSSACAYHAARQADPNVTALCEEDVKVAGGVAPERGYGEEKWFSEQACRAFMEDYGLECRVARFHNVYGPHENWNDGREKAPAALCRKVAEAKLKGEKLVDIWGDGTRTRSYCWVEDCVEGVRRLMDSEFREPLNIGSSELVSVLQLLAIVEEVADYKVTPTFDLTKPQGVAGRNSDNTKIRAELGWEPSTPLRDGIARLYPWIYEQVRNAKGKED